MRASFPLSLSRCPALKIHVSEACKEQLDRLGGYILKERGLTSIKVRVVRFVLLLPFSLDHATLCDFFPANSTSRSPACDP